MFLSDKFGTRELLNFFCILLISVPVAPACILYHPNLYELIRLLLVLSSEF